MIIAKQVVHDEIDKLSRRLLGKIDSYKGDTFNSSYLPNDNLVNFTLDRVGENKLFGYGVCQKLTFEIQDKDKHTSYTKDDNFIVGGGIPTEIAIPFTPRLFFHEAKRDEKTNNLTVTAYDKLYEANGHTLSEFTLQPPYTLKQFATAIATQLGLSGLSLIPETVTNSLWDLEYTEGGNFGGDETFRQALNAVAEVTGTVYYIDGSNNICFKQLNSNVDELSITKEHYMELSSESSHTVGQIISTTELGDNISTPELAGDKYYIRDNPFLDLREDRAIIITTTLTNVLGLTINQFECTWRGNFLVEIGDKLKITTKDNGELITYLLNDTLTYNGGFKQVTKWVYEPNDNETPSNPSNLGDALNEVFAKVDKVNKQIDLVVGQTESNTNQMSSLQLDIEGVKATVSKTEKTTEQALDEMDTTINELNKTVNTLTTKVEAGITAEDVRIEIQKELSNGTDKVITATGYVLDDVGLTVSKTNKEMTTTITEDGMQVFKSGDAVLTANNRGVDAANLHATTYLIIGNNSRLEDYSNRTACFWIGG